MYYLRDSSSLTPNFHFMATRTVRVTLPVNDTEKFITTAKALIKKHKADPANSKLNDGEVVALETQLAIAEPLRETAAKLRRDAQAAQEQCNLALGLGKGQTIKDKGTAYNLMGRMKKRLLLEFEGQEEQLGTYGMNVVISTVKARAPRKPKTDK